MRLGIAASFLLLLSLTNARMEYAEGSFVIAFGKERVARKSEITNAAIAQQAADF